MRKYSLIRGSELRSNIHRSKCLEYSSDLKSPSAAPKGQVQCPLCLLAMAIISSGMLAIK